MDIYYQVHFGYIVDGNNVHSSRLLYFDLNLKDKWNSFKFHKVEHSFILVLFIYSLSFSYKCIPLIVHKLIDMLVYKNELL